MPLLIIHFPGLVQKVCVERVDDDAVLYEALLHSVVADQGYRVWIGEDESTSEMHFKRNSPLRACLWELV